MHGFEVVFSLEDVHMSSISLTSMVNVSDLCTVCRGHCMVLMSHWQYLGTEKSEIGKNCLSAVREMEDGK